MVMCLLLTYVSCGYVMAVKYHLFLIFISLVSVQYLYKPLCYKPMGVVTFGFK